MRDTHREAKTQAEGEAGFLPGARCGTRFQDLRTTPQTKGRCSTTEPPRCPTSLLFYRYLKILTNHPGNVN